MRVRSPALSLLAAIASVIGLSASPTHADSGVTGGVIVDQGGTGVLYQPCNPVPLSWDVTFPRVASSWTLTPAIIGADAELADGAVLTGSDANVAHGAETLLLCVPRPGRYTVQVAGHWYDSDDNEHDFTLPSSSFSMRVPQTSTVLRVSTKRPARDSVVTMSVNATDERPNGYFPTAFATVEIQQRRGQTWKTVKAKPAVTDRHGTLVVKLHWTHQRGTTVAFRAVTAATHTAAASSSATVTLRGRR